MNAAAHPVSHEQISAFLDGELLAAESASVESHIQSCAECRTLASELRSAFSGLNSWHIPEIPSALESRILAAARQGKAETFSFRRMFQFLIAPTRRRSRKRLLLVFGVSGCALLLLLAITTPNLLRSRMAANESAEIGRLRRQEAQQMEELTKLREQPGSAALTQRQQLEAALAQNRALVDRLEQESISDNLEQKVAPASSGAASPIVLTPIFPNPPAEQGAEKSPSTFAPMIARTADLTIVAKDFGGVRAQLDSILVRHHGYAAQLTVSGSTEGGRSLQASLRIPAAQLDAALAELKALGHVEKEELSGEEVTAQHADLVARLTNSRETEHRLQDILRTRTGKVSDVLEVEQEIARVRGEIEQMEAERKTLEHRVDFATVSLSLSEEYRASLTPGSPATGTRLRNAMVSGYRNAVESAVSLLVWFVSVVPTLFLWCVLLALPVWLVWRRWRRVRLQASPLGA